MGRRRAVPFVRHTNPTQSRDSARAWAVTAAAVGVAGLAAAAFAAPAQAAPPDAACLRAGIGTLQGVWPGSDGLVDHPRCE